jgi:DNA-binding NtrC family response regulator
MPQANLLVLHPDAAAPTMLAAMLRALGYDRIETTSYRGVRELPARRTGLVLVGLDPIDPEGLSLVASLCRDDHAPPLVLLFTAAPPRSLHRELLNRAAAVLRFPLPTDQLGAALSLAADASGAGQPVEDAAIVKGPWNASCRPASAPADRAFLLPVSITVPAAGEPGPRYTLPVRPAAGNGADGIRPLKEALEGPERAIILEALRACDWNRNETADSLQICRSTLYHKMRRYGLFDPEAARSEAAAEASRSSSSSRT